jgi:hypothetical protein
MVKHDRNMYVLQTEKIYIMWCIFLGFLLAILEKLFLFQCQINPSPDSHNISERCVLLFSHLHIGLSRGHFPSGFLTRVFLAVLPSLTLLDFISGTVLGDGYRSWRSSVRMPPVVPIKQKCLPQHFILEYPQPVSLPCKGVQTVTRWSHASQCYIFKLLTVI